MGAALHDAAFVHDPYLVGVLDGGQTVGDDDGGATLHELFQRLLHDMLRLGVEGRGGFVEDEYRWVLEQGARDADTLSLSAREHHAAVADKGVVALGQRADEGVGIGGAGGHLHRLVAVVVVAEGDVVGDGVVEKDAVLRHQAYLPSQRPDVELADGRAVDTYLAAVGVVETRQQVDERGLAGTRRSHQGDGASLVDTETDVVQHGHPFVVALVSKADIVVLDAVVEALHHFGVGHLDDFLVGVEQLEETLGRGVALLQVVVGAHQRLDGRYQSGEDDDEEDEDRRQHLAVQHQRATEDEDAHQSDGTQYLGERRTEFAPLRHPYHGAGVVGVGALEAVALRLLAAEGFDDTQVGDILLDVREEVAQLALPLGGVAFQTLAYQYDEDDRQRQHQQEVEEQAGRDEEQRAGEEQYVDGVLGDAEQRGDDAPFDVEEVVGHAAQQVAAPLRAEIGDRQDGNLVVDVVAQPLYHALADGSHTVVAQIAAHVG